ncbi:MAG: YfhO family protein [Nitrospirota bacterium]
MDLPPGTNPPVNNILNSDAAQSVYPLLDFISKNLKDGHLPLWDPHIFLGLPTLMIGGANFAFNPLYVGLLWAFDTATAHSLSLLINLGVIASFSYLFFLRLGLTRTASLAGALALTFSGHLMAFLELALADFVFAGTAVSLYFYERSLAEPRMRFMLGNGIVLGLLLLGGSIQWVGFLVPLIGLYALLRTAEQWPRSRSLRRSVRGVTAFAVPLALGVLLAAPTLLPLPEYVALSHRAAIPFDILERAATFYPERFATFVFPNLFGTQAHEYYFGSLSFGRSAERIAAQNYNEVMVYMGVVTLPLVVLAYRVRAYRWHTAFWSGIIVGALLVAMKPPALHQFLYHYVPGFNGMQATRVLILLPLPIAFLAAVGLHGIQLEPLRPGAVARMWRGLLAATAALAVGLISAHVYLNGRATVLTPDFGIPLGILGITSFGFWLLARGRISVQVLCNGLIGLLLIDLLGFGLRLNTRVDRALVYPPVPSLRFLMDDPEQARILPLNVPYNTLMPYGISVLGGYSTMYPSSYFALMVAMERAESLTPPITSFQNRNYIWLVGYTSKLLPMLNVKYLVATHIPPVPLHPKAAVSWVHSSALDIYQTKHYFPKAFPVFRYERVATSSQAITAMMQPNFDPARTVLVEVPLVGLDEQTENSIPGYLTPLVISRPNTDEIVIEAALPKPALVVVSEQFFPGWNARVDGVPTALVKVNAALMGAVVPAGNHRLTLQFMPKSVIMGLIVSVATLSVIFAFLLIDGARHRRRSVR